MRRFSRRRRGNNSNRGEGANPLDAERWLTRVREEGLVATPSLEAIVHEDVPEHLAVVGRGIAEGGDPVVVAVSPRSAGDALLAGLATGARLAAEESYTGGVFVVAPEWSLAARRRLGVVRAELPYTLKAVAAPALAEREIAVEAEAAIEPSVVPVAAVIAQLPDAAERALFERAAGALAGLAVKHGGTLRGTPRSVELVVLARRVAELRAEPGSISLVTLQPQRTVAALADAGLAAALDALEGQIRRRLNDRRIRDGEEGMRARLLGVITSACGLRDTAAWPVGGSDHDEVDLLGLDPEGRPVVAAARNTMTLSGVGAFIDAVQALRLSLPTVLAGAAPPIRPEAPRIVLAAETFASGAVRALEGIALAHELFEIRPDRDQGYAIASIGAEEAMRSLRDRPTRRRRGRSGGGASDADADSPAAPEAEPASTDEAAAPSGDDNGGDSGGDSGGDAGGDNGGRGRGRRRRRGRGRDGGRDGAREPAGDGGRRRSSETGETGETDSGEARADRPRFEEISLFDLDDGGGDDGGDEPSGGGRGRRGRGGRRGRRSRGGDGEAAGRGSDTSSGDGDGAPSQDRGGQGGGSRRRGASASAPPAAASTSDEDDDEFADDDLADVLSELPDELEADGVAPRKRAAASDEADDVEEEEEETLFANLSAGAKPAKAHAPEAEPQKPRRRAVILARADRDSLIAAILLARDIRLLEGVWIYPQEELMGFFREVATDLRDDVPIHVVGFAPSPAIDVLQAASLYRDRITWYDHHVWAPEDDMALKQALGEESVHHTPGAGSSLPAVMSTSTRRSRFTDKLVDLATGRFTQHDYERWGRLWWWRLGEIVQKRGEVRSDVSALLTGRPSDLAKEAAKSEAPPIPEEVAFVSSRDFRIVHFVGYGMVVAEAPSELDLYLVGRIARERFAAQLSLVRHLDNDLFLLAGEELASRRVLDFGALVDHLANKLDWVTGLPGDDHVARFRIEGIEEHPGRLDEVIGEIAMGRSILER